MNLLIKPLVFVRATKVYSVPPVCSALWTVADWDRTSRVVVEPLVIDSLGFTWVATGYRDTNGHLLYCVGSKS